jgi:hypothetical protein
MTVNFALKIGLSSSEADALEAARANNTESATLRMFIRRADDGIKKQKVYGKRARDTNVRCYVYGLA